jgi:SNF2 family DNA or RNA helicase
MGPSMTQAEAGITTKKLYRTIEVPLGDVEEEIWKNVPAKIEEPTLSLYAQSAASGRPIQGTIEQSTKLDAVVEYVIEINHPCVILVRFTESLLYLWRKLQHRIKCAYIYGEDKGAAQRATVIDQFSKGTLQCLICNEATVKVGLNLSAADTLIFAENSWSGEARIQTEERATLKGKGAVEIVDFVSVGEGLLGDIDREILFAVRAKKDFNTKSMRRCHVH